MPLGNAVWPGWETQVLRAAGLPQTQQNVNFLNSWANGEGTDARFNPLATTQPAAGATFFNSFGPGGQYHVRNYTSAQQGAAATAQTLNNGRYPTVLAALRTGNPGGAILAGRIDRNKLADEISVWGTKSFAQTIRNTGDPNAQPDSPVNAVSSAYSGVTGGLDAVGGFLSKITSLDFLIRAGEVVGGSILVGMGLFLLAKQVGLADAAPSLPSPPRGGGSFDDAELAGWESAARADARRQGRDRYVSEKKIARSPGLNDESKGRSGIPY